MNDPKAVYYRQMLSPKEIAQAAIKAGFLKPATPPIIPAATLPPKRPILLPSEAGIAKARPVPRQRRIYTKREPKSLRYVVHLKSRPDLKEKLGLTKKGMIQ